MVPGLLFIKALDCGSYLKIPTDIQESNVLLGMNEQTAEHNLDNFEKNELTSPSAHKIEGDRVIYTSRSLVPLVYSYGWCFVTLVRHILGNMTKWPISSRFNIECQR